ncbi:hypothetical protein HMPREF3041_05263 [Escherichia coli]|nr:hypothetical protein HMPREF9345_03152 [Escherichia coli MS 107-1]KXG88608.1 hypothetical protein HMPREF3041_05263 [Escherichia coli]
MRSLSSLSFPAKYVADWIKADCPRQTAGYLPDLVVAQEEGRK